LGYGSNHIFGLSHNLATTATEIQTMASAAEPTESTVGAAAAAAAADPSSLRALIYVPSSDKEPNAVVSTLKVLDQLLLPHTVSYIDIEHIDTAWQVIRSMQVRGAPLIALTAVLGLSVHLQRHAATELANSGSQHPTTGSAANAVQSYVQEKLDYLATSRPTAVNLFHALRDISQTVSSVVASTTAAPDGNDNALSRVVAAVVAHAERMLEQDVQDCHALAHYGADEILALNATTENKVTLVTLCNTGSLATAGWGTALGVVRAIHETHRRLHKIVALETRPYNQGSRLTCLECRHHGLNATLICDSMVAAFLRDNGVTACVVGADRVAANGDTANKIGTYQLAVVAAAHHVPFYVAAPCTTLDVHTATGRDIVIEERPADELRTSSQAPADMPVWNPAYVCSSSWLRSDLVVVVISDLSL
jgi:S-methyl-5-thioribose-1-phosphate isomerase